MATKQTHPKVTLAEVKRRILGLDVESAKKIVCALVGHSRIQTDCFGYYNCGRCDAEVGDSLGSSYPGAALAVIVGHGCDACRKNAKTLTWRDTFMTRDPELTKKRARKAAKS